MIFRSIQTALLAGLMAVTVTAFAGAPVNKATEDKLRAALEQPGTGLQVGSVKTSEIPGMYEVQFTSGPIVYATPDGKYFIVGDMYQMGPTGFVNLAEQRRDGDRARQLAALSTDDMIVFSPKGETRAYVNVFTDVTCFYCQKLHQEVPALNAQGVEVRYMAYPRAGLESDGYLKLASAWCADNPQDALTKLKNKQPVPASACADNPIAAQYQLGQQLGVRGTPAIITQDGKMIPGYQSAADLMVTLGLN
ncbi:MAG: thiol:disulfide interchange protein DsbC [Halioglobus sp.]|jgi:thiol:disulfide interchange protein DsbC